MANIGIVGLWRVEFIPDNLRILDLSRENRMGKLQFSSRLGRFAVIAFLFAACIVQAQNGTDSLEKSFQNPPDSTKPRVWWHWMNGNVTKEGIRLDLEWMKRIGIGGFQNFDAALATPQIVNKRLVYMTEEWKDAFRYAAMLADQLGLEMAIAGSPGWSETGGPWVPPSQAMKKLVWSSTILEGGKPFNGTLPKPPCTTGPFQNIPRSKEPNLTGAQAPPPQEFYADTAVIAYRLSDKYVPMLELKPEVTSSGGQFDLAALTDGDLAKAIALPAALPGEKAWIQYEFAQPQTFRAVTFATGRAVSQLELYLGITDDARTLEASNDGKHFRAVAAIPGGGVGVHTIAFSPVNAKFFRVVFMSPKSSRNASSIPLDPMFEGALNTAASREYFISELILHTEARVDRFEDKAAFAIAPDLYSFPKLAAPTQAVVLKNNAIDLTSKMRPDGRLRLDSSGGPLDGYSPWLFINRSTQQPGIARSNRIGSGQTQQRLCKGLSRQLPWLIQNNAR